jgi:hypothetical protein
MPILQRMEHWGLACPSASAAGIAPPADAPPAPTAGASAAPEAQMRAPTLPPLPAGAAAHQAGAAGWLEGGWGPAAEAATGSDAEEATPAKSDADRAVFEDLVMPSGPGGQPLTAEAFAALCVITPLTDRVQPQ